MNIKVNDVYRFKYNEEEIKKRFEPYHCFDGTLVVKEKYDGSLILQDTYWSGSESRYFKLEDALNEGELTFICNLDEVDEGGASNELYYDEDDFITLFIHHGYRNEYYIRKGAKKSKEKMVLSAQKKVAELEDKIKYQESNLERLKETIKLIESGDLETYI